MVDFSAMWKTVDCCLEDKDGSLASAIEQRMVRAEGFKVEAEWVKNNGPMTIESREDNRAIGNGLAILTVVFTAAAAATDPVVAPVVFVVGGALTAVILKSRNEVAPKS